MDMQEIEKLVLHLAFKIELLQENVLIEGVAGHILENDITKEQFKELNNLMEKMRKSIQDMKIPDKAQFEVEMYKILPTINESHKTCELIAKAYMEEGSYKDVYPFLYGANDNIKLRWLTMKKIIPVIIITLMVIVITACSEDTYVNENKVDKFEKFETTEYTEETLVKDLLDFGNIEYEKMYDTSNTKLFNALKKNTSASKLLLKTTTYQKLYDSKYKLNSVYSICYKMNSISPSYVPIQKNDKYYRLYLPGEDQSDKVRRYFEGVLKNPASLQIHSISSRYFFGYALNTKLSENEENGKMFSSPGYPYIKVDYSAQNGFGGMNRETAIFEVWSYSVFLSSVKNISDLYVNPL